MAQGRRVEGARLHTERAELLKAGAHLFCRAQGEGQGEHSRALVAADRDAVGDAVRNRAGLAGAGTGEHAHGPVELGGDRALVGVEAREDIVSGECVLRLRG